MKNEDLIEILKTKPMNLEVYFISLDHLITKVNFASREYNENLKDEIIELT